MMGFHWIVVNQVVLTAVVMATVTCFYTSTAKLSLSVISIIM